MKKIAIIGFGIVGKGIYEILKKKETVETGNLSIKYVLLHSDKSDAEVNELKNKYNDVIFTKDFDIILNDDEIEFVCECTGKVEPIAEQILSCIEKNKVVVSSNKEVIAKNYKCFKEHIESKMLRIEASVGGGIHLFKSIDDIKKVDKILSVEGIINGTSNYILSNMMDNDADFDTALKEAQVAGFAEKDPTNDIEGFDAMYKIAILHNYIFDDIINLDTITRDGITKVTKEDMKVAQDLNEEIKLIARCDDKSASVECIRIGKRAED
ncbi:MAG: homoserine dehydrogenase, partial [Lachnospiraceae bacterium]|nr:homoserine dehydrogenase [Lachnospiraceae bacterium]